MDETNPVGGATISAAEHDHIAARRGVAPGNDLAGLALSGGGIRSATFALGVLEGLKAARLLKQVDIVSTVSGGGYIGGWLSANCLRAAQRKASLASKPPTAPDYPSVQAASIDWLDEKADWKESISHLRRYSNYLSPKLGVFSADTWSMANIWVRNTVLVQLTVFLAIAAILLLPRLVFELFKSWPDTGNWRWTTVVLFITAVSGIAGNQLRLSTTADLPLLRKRSWPLALGVALALAATTIVLARAYHFDAFTDGPVSWVALPIAFLLVLTGFALLPLGARLVTGRARRGQAHDQINYTQGWVQAAVVLPMLVTGLLMAAVLWGQTTGIHQSLELKKLTGFGAFVTNAWRYWPFPLSIALVSLWVLSFCSIVRPWNTNKITAALFAPIPAVGTLYALLCAIMLMLHRHQQQQEDAIWFAFTCAPALVLFAFSLAVVMLMGMMGRQSSEAAREWWSRLGAWLNIYGLSWMLVTVTTVYGPKLAAYVLKEAPLQLPVIGAWLATTAGGLMAGKSGSTGQVGNGAGMEKTTLQKALNVIAMVGPYVFIAGMFIGIATGLHLVLMSLSGLNWTGMPAVYQAHWQNMSSIQPAVSLALMAAILVALGIMLLRVDINLFSLNSFYRNRLVRCYLGAARFLPGERSPHRFTGFDADDDLCLGTLGNADGKKSHPVPAAPLHIVNCALNLGGSGDLSLHTRHCAAFSLTPYAIGSNYLSRDARGEKKAVGYQPFSKYGAPDKRPTLGQAMSVSGAAASPNMGYHTSTVVAFMLTVFNVRLGWWFPNTRNPTVDVASSPGFGLRYLIMELFGIADEKSDYVMISDGGHFENLAAYELIRRQCKVIVISDAEADPDLKFEGLGALIRMCEVDFGAVITLDVAAIRPDPHSTWSTAPYAIGRVDYGSSGKSGVIIYLKASMTGHEDSAILQYKACHPTFPHESTANQFYGEDQFESYRRLGAAVARQALEHLRGAPDFPSLASAALASLNAPRQRTVDVAARREASWTRPEPVQ